MDGTHRRNALPVRSIPPSARTWVLWPPPKGWPDIATRKDALLAADSFIAGHIAATEHRAYAASSDDTPDVLAVCETCRRPE